MNFFPTLTLIGITLIGLTAKSLYDINTLEKKLSIARLDIVKLQADNQLLKQHVKMTNETFHSINTTVHHTPEPAKSRSWLSVIFFFFLFFSLATDIVLYTYLYWSSS